MLSRGREEFSPPCFARGRNAAFSLVEITVRAADAQGKPALLTGRKALITIQDPLTVVLYGDTYKRVPR